MYLTAFDIRKQRRLHFELSKLQKNSYKNTCVRPHVPLEQRRPVESLLAVAAVQQVLVGPIRCSSSSPPPLRQGKVEGAVHPALCCPRGRRQPLYIPRGRDYRANSGAARAPRAAVDSSRGGRNFPHPLMWNRGKYVGGTLLRMVRGGSGARGAFEGVGMAKV